MKHFHGTPIGGTRLGAIEFARRSFLFVPWKRPEDLQLAMDCSVGFAVDNSAFSFWSTGEEPDWSQYMKWVASFCRHPRFEFAVIPDVIDGDEKQNDKLIQMWDRKMWHPKFAQGCPVWHLHESLERLERLVGGRYQYVALGSSGQWPNPGNGDGWWERMRQAFNVICDDDGYPRCRIHGLRMLHPEIVSRFPFYSCDSTNAAQNGSRNGTTHGLKSNTHGKLLTKWWAEQVMSPSTYERKLVQQSIFDGVVARN